MQSGGQEDDDRRARLGEIDAKETQLRAGLSEQEIAARFRESYPRFQYALVEFLAAHLADVSRVFDGDLQQPLILAVLGQRRLHWRAEVERLGGTDPDWSPAMAASRIADVTGVPRETVRRKLKLLAARGWIEQGAGGAWTLVVRNGAAPARADLAALDQRSMDRAARLFAALRSLP
jgi:hypothetical protein